MKILCVFGRHNYGTPERGEGYEYVNFLPAFRRLGHEVLFFDSLDKSRYRDFAELNLKLLEVIECEAPDVVFFVLKTYEVWLETLTIIRKSSSAILVGWAADDSWKYEQHSRFIAEPFHIYATTYSEALYKSRDDGYSNFVLTQWAANADQLTEPLLASACRHKVVFVGSAYGNRSNLIKQLAERGIEVQCFGYGWPGGPLSSADLRRIIRESFISLNFGDSALLIRGGKLIRDRQIKARNFEVPGYGGFLLTETLESLEHFYTPGSEVVIYEGIEDLAEKIRYYLDHPAERNAIAFAGHKRTTREHTYDMRFLELLDHVNELRSRHSSGVSHLDIAQLSSYVRKHRITWWLMPFKWVLLLSCGLVWGRVRGPRAARRIMFELSWRVFGAQTYKSTSFPGRLFYKES